jgi:hypothetical protein
MLHSHHHQKSDSQIFICGVSFYSGELVDLFALVFRQLPKTGWASCLPEFVPLKLMLKFLGYAVERRFLAITAIYLPVA